MQNFICEENDLSEIKGEITVDSPNENIYSIDGSLNFENNLSYISVTNTLLRVINFLFFKFCGGANLCFLFSLLFFLTSKAFDRSPTAPPPLIK